jgi:DNA modification methylase
MVRRALMSAGWSHPRPLWGAGTVALVAQEMRAGCESIDINPEFIALANRRLARARVAPPIGLDRPEAAD